jgi:hypothetical protein
VALSLIAIWSVYAATHVISPDLPMFALLMAYCSVVILPNLIKNRRLQVLCGVFGGLAYLAKSYALPFFLVHFTFSLGIHWLIRRKTFSVRKVVIAWGTGICAFLILAGPWVALLSSKYGQLTFSTVARITHTIIGPEDKPRYHTIWSGMYHVPQGRVSLWETPDALDYNHWSPFESRDYFLHQVKHTIKNARKILKDIIRLDSFRISFSALMFLPILVIAFPDWRSGRFNSIWMLGTVLIFSSGFLLVYYEKRYTEYFLLPLCCIYLLGFGYDCFRHVACRLLLPKWTGFAVSTIIILSFTSIAYTRAQQFWFFKTGETQPFVSYRKFAKEMREGGFRWPIAAIGEQHAKHAALYLAYFSNKPFVGCPSGKITTEIETALKKFGVGTLLVSAGGRRSTIFRSQTTWKQKLEVNFGNDKKKVYIYSPP